MDFDSIVIGAGVVGLAVARELAHSGRSVVVLDRNSRVGEESSSRNSEVIHAGIYYAQNSLKARMCVLGKELLYEYCDTQLIEHKQIGKLVVATKPSQVRRLDSLMIQGLSNGVSDLHMLHQDEIGEIEPSLCALQAIYSPSTGIIDSHSLIIALQGDLEKANGIVSVNSPAEKIEKIPGGFEVQVGGQHPVAITARELINSGGISATKISMTFNALNKDTIPPSYLSKGSYFSLSRKSPFRHLVYPLPSSEGLGIHLTLDLQGNARFGPDTQFVNFVDYNVDPIRAESFYREIRRYYPDLRDNDLQPAYAGIRPKILTPGRASSDFIIQSSEAHNLPGYISMYGIESPGLTSCMAIAQYVLRILP